MSRNEFTRKTKQDALTRSGMMCEGFGGWYGLDEGKRCNAPLTTGRMHYDHINPDAMSSDNSLDNCATVCLTCHKYKTTKIDVPRIAKMKRQRDKHLGIVRPKGRIPSRPFSKPYAK